MSKTLARLFPSVRKTIAYIDRLREESAALQIEKSKLSSSEYKGRDDVYFHYNASFDAIDTIERHSVAGLQPDPAFLTNFLGVRVSPESFPGILTGMEGVVEPAPIPSNWHADIAEWAFALRAVEMARDSFRIIELGCGWGCWLNNAGMAAKHRHLDVDLIGVDGGRGHIALTHKCLNENGFKPDEYRIIHGIAASERGKALFPVVDGPNWMCEPIFNATDDQIRRAERRGKHEVVDCYTLTDLCEGLTVDLLHIDIQGGEADFIRDNVKHINQSVRRMLVGTHSRVIEGDIMHLLHKEGWALEIERPCVFDLVSGKPVVRIDGVQGWVNSSL